MKASPFYESNRIVSQMKRSLWTSISFTFNVIISNEYCISVFSVG